MYGNIKQPSDPRELNFAFFIHFKCLHFNRICDRNNVKYFWKGCLQALSKPIEACTQMIVSQTSLYSPHSAVFTSSLCLSPVNQIIKLLTTPTNAYLHVHNLSIHFLFSMGVSALIPPCSYMYHLISYIIDTTCSNVATMLRVSRNVFELVNANLVYSAWDAFRSHFYSVWVTWSKRNPINKIFVNLQVLQQ